MSRRLAVLALVALLCGCAQKTEKRLIVIGLDGCDPNLLQGFIARGQLPNLARLQFSELGTTLPPHSPVAWATFITGLPPAETGVFDFLQRDPKTLQVVPCLTEVRDGKSRLLRRGRPFWSYLEERGIPATMLKVPAHFPPEPSGGQILSGMGTPDLLGTYGTYTYYGESPKKKLAGGTAVQVQAVAGQVKASLIGPENSSAPLTVRFEKPDVAMLEADGTRLMLRPGEWSDWVVVRFAPARGMVRFYLKSLSPFQLYASPVNLDPVHPAQPISDPPPFSRHLADCCGRFYTQGMAEESKALGAGVLDDAAYLAQSRIVFREQAALIRQGLEECKEGVLFGYISGTDLQSHLFWSDPDVILETYRAADELIGEILARCDEKTTLVVLSDHGFAPFRQSFDLNAWLRGRGYLKLEPGQALQQADWTGTRAYGVGFNSLYVNLKGREKNGIVGPAERSELLESIRSELIKMKDVIVNVYKTEQAGETAPDLVIGYASGYRGSWETALGETRKDVLMTNAEHWHGDHLVDPSVVPGVLLCNKAIRLKDPQLSDLAPSILDFFGVERPAAMRGRLLWEE